MPVRPLLALVIGAAVLATIAGPALATPSAPTSSRSRSTQSSPRIPTSQETSDVQ
jgi:hypothetical protein